MKKRKNIFKKLSFIGIVIAFIIAFANTGFYIWLKSTNFKEIIYHNYTKLNIERQETKENISIKYKYIGKKDLSWTGNITRVYFQVIISNNKNTCIYDVEISKKRKEWVLSNLKKVKCN